MGNLGVVFLFRRNVSWTGIELSLYAVAKVHPTSFHKLFQVFLTTIHYFKELSYLKAVVGVQKKELFSFESLHQQPIYNSVVGEKSPTEIVCSLERQQWRNELLFINLAAVYGLMIFKYRHIARP